MWVEMVVFVTKNGLIEKKLKTVPQLFFFTLSKRRTCTEDVIVTQEPMNVHQAMSLVKRRITVRINVHFFRCFQNNQLSYP